MEEIWKPIEGYPNAQVSSLGRIQTKFRSWAIRKLVPDKDGYLRVSLSNNGIQRVVRVNRLVCEAFHGLQPTPASMALHRDGDHTNNLETNLYWGTAQDNSDDRSRMERASNKLTWDKVREIRQRVAAGEKPFAIQGEYGISNTTIHNIVHNKAWKELVNA